MWAIKILNGPQQGKIFPLQSGNNILGRSQKADVRLDDHGVSKNHAQIFVTTDKVIISDLNSSNGTYVNGVQVQNHGLKTGDKVLVNRTIFSIFQLPDNVVFPKKGAGEQAQLPGAQASKGLSVKQSQQMAPPAQAQQSMVPQSQGNNALAHQPQMNNSLSTEFAMEEPAEAPQSQSNPLESKGIAKIVEQAEDYIDNVALPPIYKTTEKMEFKYVLMLFTFAFIFIVTFLSVFPLSQVATESVVTESKRRALTLARNLANMNRKALADNSELSLTVDFIAREAGVEKAMIVSASNGAILAPTTLMGEFVKDPFVIGLRNAQEEKTELIRDKEIGASVPIKFYDAEIGDTKVIAHAVVVYRIDSLAADFDRTLSLIIQIFVIASLIAAVIFFVQYRLIIRPLKLLNDNIDVALREGTSDIRVPFQLKVFQDLVANINSALARVTGDTDDAVSAHIDKDVEAAELVNMFPVPAFTIDPATQKFTAINHLLDQHPLFDSEVAVNSSIDELMDRSLYESLKDLLMTSLDNPNARHTNILPMDSDNYEIAAKMIVENNKPAYLLFTVMQVLEDEDM